MDNLDAFWGEVLWSDETKFYLIGLKNKAYVWTSKDKAFIAMNTAALVKHGGCSMMFWDCFAVSVTGLLYRLVRIPKE